MVFIPPPPPPKIHGGQVSADVDNSDRLIAVSEGSQWLIVIIWTLIVCLMVYLAMGSNMMDKSAEAQSSKEPVAWMARYIDKDGNEAVYTTSVYELAVENDVNGQPIPLYK
jgi:hypothetical protein